MKIAVLIKQVPDTEEGRHLTSGGHADREASDRVSLTDALGGLAAVLRSAGEFRRAQALVEEEGRLAEEVGIQPSLELDRTGCRCRLSGDRV